MTKIKCTGKMKKIKCTHKMTGDDKMEISNFKIPIWMLSLQRKISHSKNRTYVFEILITEVEVHVANS